MESVHVFILVGVILFVLVGCCSIVPRLCRRQDIPPHQSPTMIYAVTMQGAMGRNFEEMIRSSARGEHPGSFSGLTNSQTGINPGFSPETVVKPPSYDNINISPPSYQEAMSENAQMNSNPRSSTPPPSYTETHSVFIA